MPLKMFPKPNMVDEDECTWDAALMFSKDILRLLGDVSL